MGTNLVLRARSGKWPGAVHIAAYDGSCKLFTHEDGSITRLFGLNDNEKAFIPSSHAASIGWVRPLWGKRQPELARALRSEFHQSWFFALEDRYAYRPISKICWSNFSESIDPPPLRTS